MKKTLLILLAVIIGIGFLAVAFFSPERLGKADPLTDGCGKPVTQQEIVDKLTVLKDQLMTDQPIDPCLMEYAVSLMNVKTLNNVSGEIKITDIVK